MKVGDVFMWEGKVRLATEVEESGNYYYVLTLDRVQPFVINKNSPRFPKHRVGVCGDALAPTYLGPDIRTDKPVDVDQRACVHCLEEPALTRNLPATKAGPQFVMLRHQSFAGKDRQTIDVWVGQCEKCGNHYFATRGLASITRMDLD